MDHEDMLNELLGPDMELINLALHELPAALKSDDWEKVERLKNLLVPELNKLIEQRKQS